MNSQFDFFVLTEFLFQFQQYKLDLHAIFQFMFFHFSLYIFSKHHHHTKNQYSPTANIIDYLDPGTMPQQNSTIIISTTVLETVSSTQLTNHPFLLFKLIQIYQTNYFQVSQIHHFFIFLLLRN